MAQLKLQPEPTFKAKVLIPIPGSEPGEVEFTFRHRGRKELATFGEAMTGRSDADLILDLASGWDLDDEFNAETVAQMVEKYFAAPDAIWRAYIDELTKAKEKN